MTNTEHMPDYNPVGWFKIPVTDMNRTNISPEHWFMAVIMDT